MTIAATNHNRRLTYVVRWLLAGITLMAILSVGVYNSTVALRRGADQKAKTIESLKTEQAELKNTFYGALETKSLVAAAERLGYVRDGNPSYLTLAADGTARQDATATSLRTQP